MLSQALLGRLPSHRGMNNVIRIRRALAGDAPTLYEQYAVGSGQKLPDLGFISRDTHFFAFDNTVHHSLLLLSVDRQEGGR